MECDAVQSTRINIRSILEAEAKQLDEMAEIERQIEIEQKKLANLQESDEGIELQLLEIESIEESLEHSAKRLKQQIE